MEGVLRPYQQTGFRWLKTLESSGFGGISTIFGSLLAQYGFGGRFVRVSADNFLKHAPVQSLLEKADLSEHAVCRYIYAYGEKS